MGKIISIANQKGGVGKTTTAVNLGAALGAYEEKILLVDMDPQSNATSGVGVETNEESNIYTAMLNMTPIVEVYKSTGFERLKIVPSSGRLVGLEVELLKSEDKQKRLKKLLHPVKDHFDYILIDCPPSLGLLTLNALTASDSILIPIQCEYYALEGVSELISTIKRIRNNLNRTLSIEGILLTMNDERTNLSKQVRREIKDYFEDIVYQTFIPRNVRLAEAPSFGKPIINYDINSRGAQAYLDLAEEVIGNGKKSTGKRA